MKETLLGRGIRKLGRDFCARDWYTSKGYTQAIEYLGPDVIHIHFGAPALYWRSLQRDLGFPMVVSFYGYDLSTIPRLKGEDIYQRYDVFGGRTLCTVEGNFARSRLLELGCPEEKIRILHLGLDLDNYEFNHKTIEPGETIQMLFCGRFVEKKGLVYGLRALAQVVQQHPNVVLRVMGDGSERENAERTISRLGLEEHVVLLGFQPHERFIEECQRCHIFLAPSVTERETGNTEGGAPTVLLEAQACGMPIISSYHADIPEVVQDGVSGYLSPERDVDSLTANLLKLVRNPNSWFEMGLAGREWVEEHYNIESVSGHLENIYDQLILED